MKNTKNEGFVKSTANNRLGFWKRLGLVGLAFVSILGLGTTLAGCDKTPEKETTTISQVAESSVINFVNGSVMESLEAAGVIKGDKVVKFGYELTGSENDTKVDYVTTVSTSKGEGNTRIFKIAKVDFREDIPAADIAKYEENKDKITTAAKNADITTVKTFEYDGEFDADNDELAKEIFAQISDETATDLILEQIGVDKYTLIATTNTGVYTYTVAVENGTAYKDLNDSHKASFKNSIDNEDSFEIENPGTDPDKPVEIKDIGDLQTNYAENFETFMNMQIADAIADAKLDINAKDFSYVRWDIGEKTNTTTNTINLSFTVKGANNIETVYFLTTTFNSNLDLSAIAENNTDKIEDMFEATTTTKNSIKVDTKAQFYRQDIVEALANSIGATADARIMFEDLGATNGNHNFKIGYEDNNGVKIFNVQVKDAESDAELIANIANGNKTSIVDEKFSSNVDKNGEYTAPEFTIETMDELLTYFSAEVQENLEPIYNKVMKKAIGNSYADKLHLVSGEKWDLGEATNGKINNLKLSFTYNEGNNSCLYFVYNVNLGSDVSIDTLTDANKVAALTTTLSQEYLFSYDNTLQGDNDALIDAIAKVAVSDNFDINAEDTVKLYIDGGSATTPEYGISRGFKVLLINSTGIREYQILTPQHATMEEIIAEIEAGKYQLGEEKKVDFTDNQIEVDNVQATFYEDLYNSI